jgi:hypothetical protein
MPRTFYTIDDLVTFCQANNFSHFSSKEHDNKPLIVQSVETFEVEDNSKDGLLPVSLKACHIGKNRNCSSISEDVMKRDMNSFKGRPILGSIIKTDTGEFEFHSHDMKLNEDGEIEYIEQPVGVISQLDEPYLQYDEEEDKTYLHVNGHIFTEYSKAAEILQRRKTCKCSVEIAVNEMSWNCEEDYLSIDSFTFMGVTILGYEQDGVTQIEEGMKGSKITIENFSEQQNSMFANDYSGQIVDLLSRIENKIDSLSYNKFNQKGVENEMNHFEELLEKYSKTVEDIDFEYEGMSDEELDAKFAELFETEEVIETDEVVVVEEADEAEVEEEVIIENEEEVHEEVEETFELKYELSHDDIRMGLYELLNARSDSGYYCAWIMEVFDDKFIYEDYAECKFYKQSYSRDGDNVALDGDAVEVFNEWLTQEEKDALDALKSSYAELKAFKETYDATVLKAEKDAVFESAEYDEIRNTEEFKQLMSDAEKYTVDEIKTKADLLFAAAMKKKFAFSADTTEKQKSVGVNLKAKPNKKAQAYAGLFND